jgi:hypothetical protein
LEEHGCNYYHYFSEIEEHFVLKRQKNLLVSPLDWSLMASWKESGIPLHVVLRGIDRSFDSYQERSRRNVLVNTLFYCQQAVQECFAEYSDSQVGGREAIPEEADEILPREELESTFTQLLHCLHAAVSQALEEGFPSLAGLFQRTNLRLESLLHDLQQAALLHPNSLEKDLLSMDMEISNAILHCVGEETVAVWRHNAEKELRPYKKRVEKEMYEKIVKNYLYRCARQHFRLPAFTIHSP